VGECKMMETRLADEGFSYLCVSMVFWGGVLVFFLVDTRSITSSPFLLDGWRRHFSFFAIGPGERASTYLHEKGRLGSGYLVLLSFLGFSYTRSAFLLGAKGLLLCSSTF